MDEIWAPIHLPYPYEVSNLGRVRRLEDRTCGKAGAILQGSPNSKGYRRVTLCSPGKPKKTATISGLVCRAFHGPKPSDGHEVAHEDGVRTNDRADNLAWKTHPENELDKRRHGRVGAGERSGRAKIGEAEVRAIRALLMTDRFTKTEIASLFGVSDGLVSHIEYGRAWAEVDGTPWFQPNRIKRADR